MKIQILGTGCPKCKKLAQNAEIAAKELGIDYELEKIKHPFFSRLPKRAQAKYSSVRYWSTKF